MSLGKDEQHLHSSELNFLTIEGKKQFQGHKTIKWGYLKFVLVYDKVMHPSILTPSLNRFL